MQKRERRILRAPLERGLSVTLGLVFNARDVLTRFIALSFDHTERLAINEQHIVGGTGISWILANGNTDRRA